MTITFYDLLFTVPGKALSPYTWITRYCLKLKGLPFDTEWVEFVDIEEVCKKIGASPGDITRDGRERYTLPVIHDPSTGTLVSDSFKIAQYLDDMYPDTPRVIPPGTASLHRAFMEAFHALEKDIHPFLIPVTYTHVPEKSLEYYRRAREAYFKKPLEEIAPTGDTAKEAWDKVKAAFTTFDSWFEKGAFFIGGRDPCFADLMLAGRIFFIKTVFGAESREWKDIETWNEGRWGKLLQKFVDTYGP